MIIGDLHYRAYAWWLRRGLRGGELPRHIAVVMDGNRRWARDMGFADANVGHRYGAEHLGELLAWCSRLGIDQVTVYVASSDNLRKRGGDEIDHLMSMIEHVVARELMRPGNPWRLHIAGRLEVLPESTAEALEEAREATADRDGGDLTVAIGYDGQEEIVGAVRALLGAEAAAGTDIGELADRVDVDDIASHVYTAGRPDPDLIIRAGGERRLSGFLLWQATRSELYFCDVYWPGFRHVDFLRALRSYAERRRHRAAEARV